MNTLKKYIFILVPFLLGINQLLSGQGQMCKLPPPVAPVVSVDPNEILGTSGYGEENYIATLSSLNYTLYFENDPEFATAPAQEIFLADTLDLTKFNPEQFSFGTFTFRDITIEVIPGVTEFSKDVDMRDKGENIIIRISATFDKVKGIANWHLIALDPETMDLTESPFLGIVYPNTAPPIGEGNVTYRIGLRSDIPDGTVIQNQGYIVFDLNEPIATNVYVNTIDDSKPTSSMSYAALSSEENTHTISWGGTDSGSGIRDYSIYMQEGDDEFYLWQANTTEVSAEFTGEAGKTYRFYCVATDNVGNVENNKSSAEIAFTVETTGIDAVAIEGLKVYPNPVKHTLYIESPLVPIISCNITNILGEPVYTAEKTQKTEIDMSSYPVGIYIMKIETDNGSITQRIIKD